MLAILTLTPALRVHMVWGEDSGALSGGDGFRCLQRTRREGEDWTGGNPTLFTGVLVMLPGCREPPFEVWFHIKIEETMAMIPIEKILCTAVLCKTLASSSLTGSSKTGSCRWDRGRCGALLTSQIREFVGKILDRPVTRDRAAVAGRLWAGWAGPLGRSWSCWMKFLTAPVSAPTPPSVGQVSTMGRRSWERKTKEQKLALTSLTLYPPLYPSLTLYPFGLRGTRWNESGVKQKQYQQERRKGGTSSAGKWGSDVFVGKYIWRPKTLFRNSPGPLLGISLFPPQSPKLSRWRSGELTWHYHSAILQSRTLPLLATAKTRAVLCLVAQPCPTLCNPMDCSPPGCSPWGFSRQGYWSGLPFPPPGDRPDPEIGPVSPALQADSLPPELPGKPSQDMEAT